MSRAYDVRGVPHDGGGYLRMLSMPRWPYRHQGGHARHTTVP